MLKAATCPVNASSSYANVPFLFGHFEDRDERLRITSTTNRGTPAQHREMLRTNLVAHLVMLVSIIIPAFREKDFVGGAIASALQQSWTDIEVIVIDDASKDGTAEVAEFAGGGDTRLRVVRLETNRGLSGARNAGFAVARGEWIAILDADDRFERDRLATLIPEAISGNADLIADNLHVTWLNGRYADHHAFPDRRMRARTPISASRFAASDRPRWGLRAAGYMKPIVRHRFLLDRGLRYQEDIRYCEDFHFYMECLMRGAVLRYSQYCGYVYAIRPGSLSNQKQSPAQAQIDSNRLLMHQALEFGDIRTVSELKRRERDILLWNQCLELRETLQARQFKAVAKTFLDMPSKTYALARFSEKAAKELVRRFDGSHYY